MAKDKDKRKIEIATPDEVEQFASASDQGDAPDDSQAPEQTDPPDDNPGSDPPEESELDKALRERDEFREKWLRAQAEAQNQAKRLRADREEAVRYAITGFARTLLNVVDDLERSLQAAEQGADAESLKSGVRIVFDHLLKVLADHHVEPIAAVGEPFDPTCHEAMTQQPSTEHPPGTVLQEVQKGYRLHDRVLRPSRVIVSSVPAEQGQTDTGDDSKPTE